MNAGVVKTRCLGNRDIEPAEGITKLVPTNFVIITALVAVMIMSCFAYR